MNKYIIIISVTVSVIILTGIAVLLLTDKNDRINVSAQKTFIFRNYLNDEPIKIKTSDDSIVTLTGTVSEWSRRSLAEEIVTNLPGVRSVNNKLKAKSGHPTEDSDAWIGMKVKTMLMFHRNASGIKTDIDVKDGTVTLRGKALNEDQINLTSEYVSDVKGVKNVKNDMTVIKGEKSVVEKTEETIDDISITTQIKIALLFHRSTNVLKMNVKTNKGIVTISGSARDSTEKDIVGKLVNDINGVKGLINNISIR